jgi:hypothetical protein
MLTSPFRHGIRHGEPPPRSRRARHNAARECFPGARIDACPLAIGLPAGVRPRAIVRSRGRVRKERSLLFSTTAEDGREADST